MAGGSTNFAFEDSKDDLLIQLSDAIVGFASKLSIYAENNLIESIVYDVYRMNKRQIENLRLWFDIEDKSVELCQFLFCHIQPSSSCGKMDVLTKAVRRHPFNL
jgi:hypothetical protein